MSTPTATTTPVTDCEHGFEPRYQHRCALCRLKAKRIPTNPIALAHEIDGKRAAAGEY